jgi:hypothetical protein
MQFLKLVLRAAVASVDGAPMEEPWESVQAVL